MALLVILLLLALAFGIGAVVKGVLWLMLIAVLAIVVLAVLGMGSLRRSRL